MGVSCIFFSVIGKVIVFILLSCVYGVSVVVVSIRVYDVSAFVCASLLL